MSTNNHVSLAPPIMVRWLRPFAKATAVATLLLILFGSLVSSHDAGLAVPDWPTSYGYSMFGFPPSMWIGPEYWGYGGIFWEHGHRLFATAVGAMVVLLALWIWLADSRPWLRILVLYALGLVILQGVLGGLTVHYQLPTAISVSHGVLAQGFFIITIVISYGLSRERARRVDTGEHSGDKPAARWALAIVAVVFVQLVLGAWMRHSGSGLAVPDFPTTGGRLAPLVTASNLEWINNWRASRGVELNRALPPVTLGQAHVHMAHRYGAVIVTALIVGFWAHVRRRTTAAGAASAGMNAARPYLRRAANLLVALTLVQFALGAFAVLSVRHPFLTSAHVFFGAVLLGASVVLALRTLPVAPAHTQTEPAPVVGEAMRGVNQPSV